MIDSTRVPPDCCSNVPWSSAGSDLAVGKKMGSFPLKYLKIEVTHICPLRCVHCSSEAGPVVTRSMHWKDCARIVREASELGVEEITYSGGEPLCWEPLKDAVSITKELGIKSKVFTSGASERAPDDIAALIQAGCETFIFSLYSGRQCVHDSVTGKEGSYKLTLDSVSSAIRYGVDCEVHFVPLSSTYSELQSVVETAEELGVKTVSVLRYVPQGRGRTDQSLSLSRSQSIILRRSIERMRLGSVSVRTGSPFNVMLVNCNPECKAAIDRLCVGPELEIYPCDAFKQVSVRQIAGTCAFSRLSCNSLRECWELSPYLIAVRSVLAKPAHEPCGSCPLLKRCQSGCIAQSYIALGSFHKGPDPWCLLNRASNS